MYDYTITNNGNILNLTGQDRKWLVRSVSGLNPPASRVFESEVVGVAGVNRTGSKVGKRNIVFTIHINHPCEQNRAELLNVLAPDSEITLAIKTPLKTLTIDGFIESCEYTPYTNAQTMQVSILCGHPYFKLGQERTTNYVMSSGGFEFPLLLETDEKASFDNLEILDRYFLYNYGRIPTGLKIKLEVYNDCDSVNIYNVDDTSKYFKLKHSFKRGDVILIDTNVLAKEKVMLVRGATKTKILNKLVTGATWFQVANLLVLAVEGNVYMTVTNHDEIAGV